MNEGVTRMKPEWKQLKTWIDESDNIVFFGGAGVSTESGIPDFRSTDGLFNQQYDYPPEVIVSHSFFEAQPEEFYRFLRDRMIFPDAQPNAAHKALATLEKQGKLKAVITQNIDGLHQLAGNKNVLELHGSMLRHYCLRCGKKYGLDFVANGTGIPRCECGGIVRPDVVLYLPNNKQIIIDSKVSLTAYVNYVSAQTEAERRVAMAAHLASVRQHVKELSAKKYQQLMQSPDFVVMFVPNEPAFLDALKEDHSIWSDAYDKKVVVSSPTNLFALLKLVDDLWRRDDQNKNQENIIKFGVTLYEQLVAFTSALEGVGASLDQARTKYDEAFKRLSTGNNNIIRVGEKLRKLGLPTTKRQSARLVEECGADEDNNLIENE
jgi:NAD-dependent SIR2 family protein deacetylase